MTGNDDGNDNGKKSTNRANYFISPCVFSLCYYSNFTSKGAKKYNNKIK